MADSELKNKHQQPGKLYSDDSHMTLQTKQALMLFYGREMSDSKPGIIGLTRFSNLLKQVYQCSRANDPWADFWLYKIENEMDNSKDELLLLKKDLELQLEKIPNVSISLGHTDTPVQVPLSFSNPLSYRAAYIISNFDDYARLVLTTKHVGILNRHEGERLLNAGGKIIRRVLSSVQGYRFSGATRDDVRQMNKLAINAIESMGECPKDILDGEKQSNFAPVSYISMNKRSDAIYYDVNKKAE